MLRKLCHNRLEGVGKEAMGCHIVFLQGHHKLWGWWCIRDLSYKLVKTAIQPTPASRTNPITHFPKKGKFKGNPILEQKSPDRSSQGGHLGTVQCHLVWLVSCSPFLNAGPIFWQTVHRPVCDCLPGCFNLFLYLFACSFKTLSLEKRRLRSEWYDNRLQVLEGWPYRGWFGVVFHFPRRSN